MNFSYSKFSFANMKTIVTLIFLGYLGCTFACYDSLPSSCKDLENKAKLFFSADSFFSGDWYVTHSKTQGGQLDCSKFETSIIGNIKLKYQRGGQNVKCTGENNSLKKYICFDCNGSGSGSSNKFKKFFMVLETDSYYADYALVYVCNQAGTTSNDNFLVLRRTKSNSVPSDIKSAISKVGEKPCALKSNICKK